MSDMSTTNYFLDVFPPPPPSSPALGNSFTPGCESRVASDKQKVR